MSAPLTMEDINQFHNLPLINVLRNNNKSKKDRKGAAKADQGEENASNKGGNAGGANDRPPAFFDDDMSKWKLKFSQAIQDRALVKRQMLKTLDVSCLTRNTNIKSIESGDKTNGLDDKTLFGKVMKRRNSRQSTYAPINVDFDYAGDSAPYQHLIA